MGRLSDALKAFEEAHAVTLKRHGPDHAAVASLLSRIGGVHKATARARLAAVRLQLYRTHAGTTMH